MPPHMGHTPKGMVQQQQPFFSFQSGPSPAAQGTSTEVAPIIESVRAEAEQRIEHTVAAVRAECDAKVQLARVRVAELEERVRRAEIEGDSITAKMTLMEVHKAEAERTRDSAVERLEEIVSLIKGNGGEETYVIWLEAQLAQEKAEREELSKAL